VGYNNFCLARFRWPVLKCPSLAGFQVSPEALYDLLDHKASEFLYRPC
jgi:hypothetical protein